MKVSTSLALLSLSSAVSAALVPSLLPYCWRKCARQAGLMCTWGDIPCLCKSVNPGLMASANACACSSCDKDDDSTHIQFSELAFACKVARIAFKDPSDGAPTCNARDSPPPKGSPPTPPNGPPPPPAVIPPVAESAPTPTSNTPKLPSSVRSYSVSLEPLVPSFTPFPYLSVEPSNQFLYPHVQSPLVSIPPIPPASRAPVPTSSSLVISIPIAGVAAGVSDTSSSESIVYATLTVPVVPIPQSSPGAASGSKSTSAAVSKTKASTAPTSSTGSAVRREVGTVWWAVSMLTAAAIVVYGVA